MQRIWPGLGPFDPLALGPYRMAVFDPHPVDIGLGHAHPPPLAIKPIELMHNQAAPGPRHPRFEPDDGTHHPIGLALIAVRDVLRRSGFCQFSFATDVFFILGYMP